jgi:hypothetical protein
MEQNAARKRLFGDVASTRLVRLTRSGTLCAASSEGVGEARSGMGCEVMFFRSPLYPDPWRRKVTNFNIRPKSARTKSYQLCQRSQNARSEGGKLPTLMFSHRKKKESHRHPIGIGSCRPHRGGPQVGASRNADGEAIGRRRPNREGNGHLTVDANSEPGSITSVWGIHFRDATTFSASQPEGPMRIPDQVPNRFG